jgi:antitoxin MazE
MKARVQKWGNSLALRIPRAFASQVGLAEDSLVELSLEHDSLVLRPVSEPSFALQDLLANVTEENVHAEVETGPARGREAW